MATLLDIPTTVPFAALQTEHDPDTPDASPVARGFTVPCLRCGDTGCVRVSLDDVSRFTCSSCDADYSTDDVRDILASWNKVLTWLDSAPPVE